MHTTFSGSLHVFRNNACLAISTVSPHPKTTAFGLTTFTVCSLQLRLWRPIETNCPQLIMLAQQLYSPNGTTVSLVSLQGESAVDVGRYNS
jgi:hypothetical protein